jgi:phosphoribosylformylglycinamidine cyclo-ligase
MTDAYEAAGVSFDSGAAVIDRISAAVKSTHDDRVVSGLGGFGGVFDLASLSHLNDPLLVTSTDGVGTKTKLSAAMDLWEGAGADIVNHGINDVLVQGAAPLLMSPSWITKASRDWLRSRARLGKSLVALTGE